MIHFGCQHCRGPVCVDDKYAGKRGRCPHCKQVVSIPGQGNAIAALAAALEPDSQDADDGSLAGHVPPPPGVEEKPLEEEFILPTGDDVLADTVILPAEGGPATDTQPADRRHHRAAQRSAGINGRRTLLIVGAVIVVLAAAVIGFVILSRLR